MRCARLRFLGGLFQTVVRSSYTERMARPRHEQLLEQLHQRLVPLVGRLKSVPLTRPTQALQARIASSIKDASDYSRGAQRGLRLNQMHVELQLERALTDCAELERLLGAAQGPSES